MGTMIGKLTTFVIDCPDPRALAEFYAELTGLKVDAEVEDWVWLGDSPPRMAFQRALDHKPPRWPDPEFPQQYHLDIEVDDIATAEPKVLALGATRLPGGGESFRVYADPAGHPFCLTW